MTQCVVDKTAPIVSLTGLTQCYLKGIINDDNLSDWKVYIKEAEDTMFSDEPICEGTDEVGFYHEIYGSDAYIGYIDFTQEQFSANTDYTVKVVATDKTGNTTVETTEITSPLEAYMPIIIPAELEIEKEEALCGIGHFTIGMNQDVLTLVGDVANPIWYINNRKAEPNLKTADGNLLYDENWWHDVLALTIADDGIRKYTVDRIENGLSETVSFTEDEIQGNVGTTSIQLYSSAVAFRIIADANAAMYQIRPETMDGEGAYTTIAPNQTYYIDELYENSAFAEQFDIKASAKDGYEIEDIQFILYADNITNQQFRYSEAELYAPQNLRVENKINHRTYIKWDVPETIPEAISYNVYRGTEEDFIPDECTLVASGLKTGYFTEMNVSSGKTFYYKVCSAKAVEYVIDTDTTFVDYYYSDFKEVKGSRTVDQNEFLKRLGMKEFWEFTEFNTPNGEGYVEKSKGNFLYQQQDAEIPNEGFDVSLTRTYNSQSSSFGNFGYGWTYDYDLELLNICENNSMDFTHVVLKDGNGTIYHFTRDSGEEEFVSSLGSYVNLSAESNEQKKTVLISGNEADHEVELKYQFVLSTKDGVCYYFNSGGQLILMEDGNEKFVLFEYDIVKGVISKIITNNNSTIELIYHDGIDGTDELTVKEICLPDGSKVQYEYTKSILSSEQLLTKVTKISGGERITYEYSYDRGFLSLQPKNLTEIKEAEYKNIYKINYDFSEDRVTEVVYPNNEKFTFEYAKDNTFTITKKHSGGKVVLGEKDFFDRIYGKCEKSIRGVDDVSVLDDTDEEGLDVTTYEYQDQLLIASTTTAEYRDIDSDGYIAERRGTKVSKVTYSGDNPTKEVEEDGSISEYTYYSESDGEHLVGQIKTVKETNADGKILSYQRFKYDAALNVTETIDYIAETKVETTYYIEGAFQGEIHTMKESLLTVASDYSVSDEVLSSTSTYTYETEIVDESTIKTETCTQVIPNPDGTSESITTSTVYDNMGRVLKETDNRGYQSIHTYDGFGRIIATTYKYSDSDQLKQSTAMAYDNNNMLTYEKLADGTEKWYTYDNMYQIVSIRVKKGDTEETIHTSYSYQDVDVYQGKGNDTITVRNAYVTEQSYSDGTILSKTYEDHQGNVVREYSNGLYTDMTYNSQGDKISQWCMGKSLSEKDGVLELYLYDDEGNLTATITDPDYVSGTDTTGYFIREDSTQEQGTIVTKSSYDADGNVTEEIDALGNITKYTYDKEGNLSSVLQPDNVLYEYRYDIKAKDHTTQDIVYEPRVSGTSADREMSKSVVTKDSTDKIIKVEDFGISDTDDTSIRTSYEYDIRDNLIKETYTSGNYKTYTYDIRDRVTEIVYYESSSGTAEKTRITEYTYDDSDNITSMTDKKVKDHIEYIYRYTAYGYDAFNRLAYVSECDTDEVPGDTVIDANKIKYEYDIKDRIVAIDYPNSHLGITGLRFHYDSNSWLQNITAVGEDGKESLLRVYSYDTFGRTIEILDYPDTLNSTAKWVKRTYTYDKLSRTTDIVYTDNLTGSGTDVKASYSYGYDKNGNIVVESIIDTYGYANGNVYGGNAYYTYDVNNRLVTKQKWDRISENLVGNMGEYYYTYDAAGNKVAEEYFVPNYGTESTTTYVYNEFNQLISKQLMGEYECEEDFTYTYDADGNQTQIVDHLTGTEVKYSYDVACQLIKVVSTTDETIDYIQENQYNGLGQRIEKTETVGSETNTLNYFYDGSQILYTTDAGGSVTSFNMVGIEDTILCTARPAEEEISGSLFYLYVKDIRESTSNLLGTDGTAAVSYRYDAWGETTVFEQNEEEPFYNEICYTAGVYDKTTGLYNLNARYYDPSEGVFLSQDTYRGQLSRTETLNYYAYCAGNPLSYTDPSGHAFWAIAGAALGAYDGYKYAKKKKLKGWKKGAAVAGGALLGAVNPFKIAKGAGKAVKIVKAVKNAKKAKKVKKAVKAIAKKAKKTAIDKKTVKVAKKAKKTKKTAAVTKNESKKIKENSQLAKEKKSEEITGDVTKPYETSRPSFRKGVVEKVWENAKDADGLVRDPNTKEIIDWVPGQSRKGVWDMGHVSAQKYSETHAKYMRGEMSKSEFLDWYNNPNHYRPELPHNNRSHKFE